MPFAMRNVEPTRLSYRVKGTGVGDQPPDEEDTELQGDYRVMPTSIAQRTLLRAMQQLACLVRHADDMFCDLAEECHKIIDRAERIQGKLHNIREKVELLDFRTVSIPVGDLKAFCQVERKGEHHVAKLGYDNYLFTPDIRPQCVKDMYDVANNTPADVIRCCDAYRKDGHHGSMLFKLWPVMSKQAKQNTPELYRKSSLSVITFEKDYKPLRIKLTSVKEHDTSQDEVKDNMDNKEKEEMSQEAMLVPIDITGSNFTRMCSFRESLRNWSYEANDEKTTKKKRRKTVTGIPEDIWKDLCEFERTHSKRKKRGRIVDKIKSYSFDELDAGDAGDEQKCLAYLQSVDDRIEERALKDSSAKEPGFKRFLPCRRSCSVPRSAKLSQVVRRSKSESRLSSSCKSESGSRPSSCLISTSASSSSLHSEGSTYTAFSRQSRATRRSSNFGVKLRSLISSHTKFTDRPRPKSLDFDLIDLETIDFDPEPVPQKSKSCILSRTSSAPENVLNNIASTSSSSVGPGAFYHFDSHTLPRAQAKKYNFPWETLPKDWTTSVKLREISKRKGREDHQSSSGNWSDPSSARQSMESENILSSMGGTSVSQKSLGTDSGRDSPTSPGNSNVHKDKGAVGQGVSEVVDPAYSLQAEFSQRDTEAWLQSLAVRAAKRPDASNSSKTLLSLSGLTKKNIEALDAMSPTLRGGHLKLDDEESSVYSLDQDGFYTSFHNDSGLRRSTGTLVDHDEIDGLSPVKEHSVGYYNDNTVCFSELDNSDTFDFMTPKSTPAPPCRTTSLMDSGGSSDTSDLFQLSAPSWKKSPDISPDLLDMSLSESDPEIIYARLKRKTKVPTSTAFPSLCSVSPIDSEDESVSSSGKKSRNLHNIVYDKNLVEVVNLRDTISAVIQQRTSDSFLSNDYSTNSSKDENLNSFGKVIYKPPIAPTLKSGTADCVESSPLSVSNNSDIDTSYCYSLPRPSHLSIVDSNFGDGYAKSWPRSANKSHSNKEPSSGILKSMDKISHIPPGPKKVLNFSPVVNLFSPNLPKSVQKRLVELDQEDSKSIASSFSDDGGKFYRLPLSATGSSDSESSLNSASSLPVKCLPGLMMQPGIRSIDSDSEKSSSLQSLSSVGSRKSGKISPLVTSTASPSFSNYSLLSSQTCPDESSPIINKPSLSSSLSSPVSSTSSFSFIPTPLSPVHEANEVSIYKDLIASPTVDSGLGSVSDLCSPSNSSMGMSSKSSAGSSSPGPASTNISGEFKTCEPTAALNKDANFMSVVHIPSVASPVHVKTPLSSFTSVSTSVPLRESVQNGPGRTISTPATFGTYNSNTNNNYSNFSTSGKPIAASLNMAKKAEPVKMNMSQRPQSLSYSPLTPAVVYQNSIRRPTSVSDSQLLCNSQSTGVVRKPGTVQSTSALLSGSAQPVSGQARSSVTIRSSSYRAATGAPGRTGSYRSAMYSTPMSTSSHPVVNLQANGIKAHKPDSQTSIINNVIRNPPIKQQVINQHMLNNNLDGGRRSDSYRAATNAMPVSNGHTLSATDTNKRAGSYRAAMHQNDTNEAFEYKPVNKRAAITSIDQLLPKPANDKSSKTVPSILNKLTNGKINKHSGMFNGKGHKSMHSKPLEQPLKPKHQPKGSTYIRFDPIEEVREDMSATSMESLRTPSLSSLVSYQSRSSVSSGRTNTSTDTLVGEHVI